jgi:hypothetical protein
MVSMPQFSHALRRSVVVFLCLILAASFTQSALSQDKPAPADPKAADSDGPDTPDQPAVPPGRPAQSAPAAANSDQSLMADLSRASSMPAQSTMTTLINRLVQRGALTKQDSAELLLMSEADAADARAQAALTQAAIAVAAAAQARARAIGAQAAYMHNSAPGVAAGTAAAESPDQTPEEQAEAPAAAQLSVSAAAAATAAGNPTAPINDDVTDGAALPPPVHRTRAPGAKQSSSNGAKKDARAKAAATEPPEAPVPDDIVRVTYVPDIVKEQLRQEVTQDVLDNGRKEGWATPGSVPEWISRFTLFGDLRLRYEMFRYPQGNDTTGSFPNFNLINTGAPFDTSGNNFPPEFNVDQDRTRFRLRAQMGAGIDLGHDFSVGLQLATGNDDQPVSENQTIGAAGSAQGGDFSKYAVWLDRAFIKYEAGGKPDEDVTVEMGRFDNPFFSTSMIWADALAFDGAAVKGKYHFGEDVTPFITFGAFPVFNTDLSFASNQPAKYSSYNKWLYAGQIGSTFELGRSVSLKLAVAYYQFHNIEGQLSTPFTPLTTADVGNTDDSRPSFAQYGNTYMALRDIVASPLNDNGTIDQFQYYGLASKFHELALDGRLDFNQFEPFQISVIGEYVKNRGFNDLAVAALAVNNFGPTTSTAAGAKGPFQGSATAWLLKLQLGDATLQSTWDWNVNIGYRSVGSDAVVDGFSDADFGGGGTNFKGPTLGGNLAFTPDIWLEVRWMSATEVGGPILKNDILQLDVNTKF